MPPPPSDQELIAKFSPLQHEFYAWYSENWGKMNDLRQDPDKGARARFVREAWPHIPHVETEFFAWQHEWTGRLYKRKVYQMTLTDFLNLFRGTNFMDRGSFASYCWKMEMYKLPPLVLLGESRFGNVFTGYALLPGSQALWPHLDIQPDDPALLHSSIMGINLNVHIDDEPEPDYSAMSARRRRRQQARSSGEDSVRSTDSDDIENRGGFTFVQIGSLYSFGSGWDEKRNKRVEDIIVGPWLTTGFAVVVEIDVHGRLGPVWVIYSFYDRKDDLEEDFDYDDATGYVAHIPTKDAAGNPLPHIGRPAEGCSGTFTVAKIANSLRELGQGHTRQFNFDVLSQCECQVVRAKIYSTGQGRWLLRQFVKSR